MALTPNDWHELEPLIDRVLDTPHERRAEILAQLAGGDPSRRAKLERLVAECERDFPLLDRPVTERFGALMHGSPSRMRIPEVLADRYRIVRELGRGGMAVVYLAQDLKHDRDVAVKIVQPELAATLGRVRFLREIAIASKLKHPHIVPLFDSGEVDDWLFYVMPYQEGQSLRERLKREGPLPVADTIGILSDVCDALAHAHQQGIVHRDIKPDNILLAGRHALVTDFGVARALTAASEQDVFTTAGGIVGTAAYMAPEQGLGDGAVDHRADIYALGVTAYEMLTGVRPFVGATPPSQRAEHAEKAALDLTRLRSEVPPALATVVMQCLEARVADRLQSADAILEALGEAQLLTHTRRQRIHAVSRRSAVGATAAILLVAAGITSLVSQSDRAPSPQSASAQSLGIGILPVRAVSPTGDLEWLSTGLENELSKELTGVPGLEVRPTETIAAHLANNWSLDSVAHARNVDYFVRATLSRGERDSIVATLELIEGGLRSVRAGSVNEPPRAENAVPLLGRRVAEHLRPMLGSRVRERQLESGARNALALQRRRRADHHRLMARTHLDKADLTAARYSLDTAHTLLVESQRLDPTWTAPRLARAALSELTALLRLHESRGQDYTRVQAVFDAGIAVLDTVLTQSPNDAVALALRGRLRLQRALHGRPPHIGVEQAISVAEPDLRSAIGLDSTLPGPTADLSQILFQRGNYVEAARYAERAYQLDAYMEGVGGIIGRLATSKFESGEDSQAAFWCAEGRRREPANPAPFACLLEVMAWGSGKASPDSAWLYFREIRNRLPSANEAATAYFSMTVAAVLARARAVEPDSVRAVVRRARDAATGAVSQRDDFLAYEAAVLFRLSDSLQAAALFAQLRQRNPARAQFLAQRRLLRGFVRTDSSA
ncbi:MAG TPA: serine/threonine-protein kinase [Gemmatimonadaceae bacterium]|nr:serine/threonine-protein kinase [Gemmatimonadaceae bacterium]